MKSEQTKIIYKDIDSYIALQPVSIRPTLEKMRYTIIKAVPKAEEMISYQMPCFRYHGMLIYFAAFKKHYSIFARPVFLQAFEDEIVDFKTSKSAINFPLDLPVQVKLITKIVKYVAKENENAVKLKAQKKIRMR